MTRYVVRKPLIIGELRMPGDELPASWPYLWFYLEHGYVEKVDEERDRGAALAELSARVGGALPTETISALLARFEGDIERASTLAEVLISGNFHRDERHLVRVGLLKEGR